MAIQLGGNGQLRGVAGISGDARAAVLQQLIGVVPAGQFSFIFRKGGKSAGRQHRAQKQAKNSLEQLFHGYSLHIYKPLHSIMLRYGCCQAPCTWLFVCSVRKKHFRRMARAGVVSSPGGTKQIAHVPLFEGHGCVIHQECWLAALPVGGAALPCWARNAAQARKRRCSPCRARALRSRRALIAHYEAEMGVGSFFLSRLDRRARRGGRMVLLSILPSTLLIGVLPRGERRALPAPTQGINPLRIPLAAARSAGRCIPPVPNAAGGRPLRVGRQPSIPASAPTGTKQSAHAPYSWGMGAFTRSRRRWPAAPPPYSET